MTVPVDTRPRQLTLDEVAEKYPQVPRLVIIKTDVQRRGVHYTPRAVELLDEQRHQVTGTHIFGARDGKLAARPESLLLRDGTSIITTPTPLEQNPYTVDVIDGQPVLVDRGQVVEEVEYWPRPDFYAKKTASGIPLKFIVSARPKRLSIFPYRYCQFWNEDKGCLFCDIVPQLKKGKRELGIPPRLDPEKVGQAVGEALTEPGRFTGICLTGGSILAGEETFDDEVDYYIKVLQAIGKNFRTAKFTSQLIATAFSEKQLRRLYDQTGLMSYTADIEVFNEAIFNWICPGKAKWVGYQEWKRRLVRAVDVFGRGRVNTGIVGGVELAKPHGFSDEEEALESTLAEAEDLARHGVSVVFIVWSPRPDSALGVQKNASLEYYVRLAWGLHQLRVKYGIPVEFDDYRNCGNHPDTDLLRLL
ncbi:MAG: radical SAM protein [Bacillota bacterium]